MTAHLFRTRVQRIAALLVVAFAATMFLAMQLPTTNAALTSTTESNASFGMLSFDEITATAVWHLDGSDSTSMYTDHTCTTRVTALGDPVECWTDQNVPGQAVVHDTAEVPILKREPALGNMPVLHFQGAHLLGPDVFGGTVDGLTIFIVSREHQRTPNWLINLNAGADNNRLSMHVPWTDGRIYTDLGNKNNGRSISVAPAVGTPLLMTAWRDPAIGRTGHHINHSTDYLSSGLPIAYTTGGFQIGRSAYHDVAEVIIFDRRLSEPEETIVESYLSTKWSLP